MEPRVLSSSSSEDEEDAVEAEVEFRAERAGISSNCLNFTGPPNGVEQSAASDTKCRILSLFNLHSLF